MQPFEYQPPQQPYRELLYQDDHVVVVNKPSGLLSVPGRLPEHKDSLALRLQRVFPTATVVHRLDMATSGLMVLALSLEAHRHLSRQFQERRTHKRYQAILWGHLTAEQGEVDLPLRCDWPNRPRQMVDHQQGKSALTRWQVLNHLSDSTLVELTPVTGRSHQLRVHMLSLGHPIVGDQLYAEGEALTRAERLQLHASELGFDHPLDQRPLQFHAPVTVRDGVFASGA